MKYLSLVIPLLMMIPIVLLSNGLGLEFGSIKYWLVYALGMGAYLVGLAFSTFPHD